MSIPGWLQQARCNREQQLNRVRSTPALKREIQSRLERALNDRPGQRELLHNLFLVLVGGRLTALLELFGAEIPTPEEREQFYDYVVAMGREPSFPVPFELFQEPDHEGPDEGGRFRYFVVPHFNNALRVGLTTEAFSDVMVARLLEFFCPDQQDGHVGVHYTLMENELDDDGENVRQDFYAEICREEPPKKKLEERRMRYVKAATALGLADVELDVREFYPSSAIREATLRADTSIDVNHFVNDYIGNMGMAEEVFDVMYADMPRYGKAMVFFNDVAYFDNDYAEQVSMDNNRAFSRLLLKVTNAQGIPDRSFLPIFASMAQTTSPGKELLDIEREVEERYVELWGNVRGGWHSIGYGLM